MTGLKLNVSGIDISWSLKYSDPFELSPASLEWFLSSDHWEIIRLEAYLMLSMGNELYNHKNGIIPRLIVGKFSIYIS
jgi:hypothetical protein